MEDWLEKRVEFMIARTTTELSNYLWKGFFKRAVASHYSVLGVYMSKMYTIIKLTRIFK